MEQQYAAPDPGGPCQFCRLRPPAWQVRLGWLAVYNTKEDVVRSAAGLAALLAIGHGATFEHKARFSTHHSCCADCYWRLLVRRAVTIVAEKLCLVVLVIGMLGAVAAVVCEIVFRSDTSNEARMIFIVALILTLIGLAIGIGMPKLLRRWRSPQELRSVGRWPYVLQSIRRSDINAKPIVTGSAAWH